MFSGAIVPATDTGHWFAFVGLDGGFGGHIIVVIGAAGRVNVGGVEGIGCLWRVACALGVHL